MSEWEPSLNQRVFIAALAKLVSPMQSADATNAMMAMLPGLKHLPEATFDKPADLAATIAGDWDRVPTLGRLRKALDAVAPKQQLADPYMPIELREMSIPGEDRQLASLWLRHFDEGHTERELTIELAVIRRYGPAGYRWLINARSNAGMRAAEIAVRQKWTGSRHEAATDDEKDEVSRTVQQIGSNLEMDRLYGPSGRVLSGDPPVAAPKSPGTLSPEQLRIVREQQNPALAAIVYAEPPVESAEVVSLGDMREKKRAVEPPPLPWEMDSAAC